jgi:hypothetical protein
MCPSELDNRQVTLWYRITGCFHTHVGSFRDFNNDGFPGRASSSGQRAIYCNTMVTL